jgi:hypothetical protein
MKAFDVGELLEVIEDRNLAGSIIIASQLPVSQWHDYLNQPVVADAIFQFMFALQIARVTGEPLKDA